MRKTNNAPVKGINEMSLTPSKDALLAREIRRSDRLANENSLLRVLLQEAKRGCGNSGSSDSVISLERNV